MGTKCHCRRLGYHSFQMQQRLHLHVLSYDLCGTGMNTIWHWNSFTTPFFLKSEEVIDHLAKRGFVKVPPVRQCLGWLNGPMLCHFCTCNPGDVYLLKDHVKEHFNGTDYFHLVPRKKNVKTPSYKRSDVGTAGSAPAGLSSGDKTGEKSSDKLPTQESHTTQPVV